MKINLDETQLNTDWMKTLNADFPTGITEEAALHAIDKKLPVTLAPNWRTTTVKEFDESLHPRDDIGRFADAGGGGNSITHGTGFNADQKNFLEASKDSPTIVPWLDSATFDRHEQTLDLRDAVLNTADKAYEHLAHVMGDDTIDSVSGAMKETMERSLGEKLAAELPPETLYSRTNLEFFTSKIDTATGYNDARVITPEEFGRIKGELLAGLGNSDLSKTSYNFQDYLGNIAAADSPSSLHFAIQTSPWGVKDDDLKNTYAAIYPLTKEDYGKLGHDIAKEYIDSWASSSSDHNSNSVGMQEAAMRVLGASSNGSFDDSTRKVASDLPADKQIEEILVRGIYDNTQKYLKENGITEVQVHRGMDFYDSGSATVLDRLASENNMKLVSDSDAYRLGGSGQSFYVGEKVPFDANPLSSYSTSVNTAHGFATENFYGNDDRGSVMVHATIPAKDIFSLPATGVGCLDEGEVVAIARPDMTATVELRYVPPS